MLPKKNRLKLPDFYSNRIKSQKHPFSFFDFFIKVSKEKNPRFVFVVPKTLDKRSSIRNRTRRIFVEIVRKHLYRFKNNIDVLIKAKRTVKEKDPIEKELFTAFTKTRLIE